MIESIDINNFQLLGPYCLIKVDPDYDFIEIPGPEGTKVILKIIDPTIKDNTKNIAITGTILSLPDELYYFSSIKTHKRGETIAQGEFEALMHSTMPHDVDLDVKPGDRVVFNYKAGLTAEEEGRLLKDENGYCMLIRYDILFGKEVNGELVPLNGWVFFIRDQKPSVYQMPSGVWCYEKIDKYGILKGTVVSADKPIREYIDRGAYDDPCELLPGHRIIVQPKFGYRIAHDLHAGDLEGLEVIKRKNILCLINEEAKSAKEYFILN